MDGNNEKYVLEYQRKRNTHDYNIEMLVDAVEKYKNHYPGKQINWNVIKSVFDSHLEASKIKNLYYNYIRKRTSLEALNPFENMMKSNFDKKRSSNCEEQKFRISNKRQCNQFQELFKDEIKQPENFMPNPVSYMESEWINMKNEFALLRHEVSSMNAKINEVEDLKNKNSTLSLEIEKLDKENTNLVKNETKYKINEKDDKELIQNYEKKTQHFLKNEKENKELIQNYEKKTQHFLKNEKENKEKMVKHEKEIQNIKKSKEQLMVKYKAIEKDKSAIQKQLKQHKIDLVKVKSEITKIKNEKDKLEKNILRDHKKHTKREDILSKENEKLSQLLLEESNKCNYFKSKNEEILLEKNNMDKELEKRKQKQDVKGGLTTEEYETLNEVLMVDRENKIKENVRKEQNLLYKQREQDYRKTIEELKDKIKRLEDYDDEQKKIIENLQNESKALQIKIDECNKINQVMENNVTQLRKKEEELLKENHRLEKIMEVNEKIHSNIFFPSVKLENKNKIKDKCKMEEQVNKFTKNQHQLVDVSEKPVKNTNDVEKSKENNNNKFDDVGDNPCMVGVNYKLL